MPVRYPVRDQVAIAGIGTTGFSRDFGGRTALAMAVEACKKALEDAGLAAKDVDGIVGVPAMEPKYVTEGLGIPELRYWNLGLGQVVTWRLADAMNAIHSGAADTVLIYHTLYRGPGNSQSAARDEFRKRSPRASAPSPFSQYHQPYNGVSADYAGWMSRYMKEYGATREDFGLVAINDRSNAALSDYAVMRSPITMEDYLSARMIRDPFCLLDMDLPIDGADAMVLTTAARARSLRRKPVYIHALSHGMTEHPEPDQNIDLRHLGQQVALKALWERSDFALSDMDVFFPYDGFSIITLNWIENVGYCGKGEAGAFMRQHWDKVENRVKVNGRVPFNTHGGALCEGATQGSGHLREAVVQLRGDAAHRQVPGAKAALVTPGGFHFNSSAVILRAD